jgi:hypothetical protein
MVDVVRVLVGLVVLASGVPGLGTGLAQALGVVQVFAVALPSGVPGLAHVTS